MDITLVFFIYGLAFFSMGLAMMFESSRSPLLAQARVLRPLAVFGLVHGSHEWMEMFLDKSDWLVFQYPLLISWVRVIVLLVSFISLAFYGLWVLLEPVQFSGRSQVLILIGVIAYALLLVLIGWFIAPSHDDRLTHVDAMARSLLAVPAAAIAGFALRQQARQAEQRVRSNLGSSLRWASAGFFVYAVTQAVIPPVDILFGNYFNTAIFIEWTGFPIQIVRAITAVVITISLIQATQSAEEERQNQLFAAQQARMQALDQLQREMEHRETLRQELLRHTVIAQEEERARIARELHDETSQTLTAFSLHIAALRDAVPDCPKVADQLRQLQSLNRNISEGIYRLIHDLRPAHLDDLGLAAALKYLSEQVKNRVGLHVQLNISGEGQRLDPLLETVIFRITQEALTNVARHAKVNSAVIELEYTEKMVCLRVQDDGIGFDLEVEGSSRWGLAGMRERAKSVGARFEINSVIGEGTVVETCVPIGESVVSSVRGEPVH
jgi:signal transduction histidine kinase